MQLEKYAVKQTKSTTKERETRWRSFELPDVARRVQSPLPLLRGACKYLIHVKKNCLVFVYEVYVGPVLKKNEVLRL